MRIGSPVTLNTDLYRLMSLLVYMICILASFQMKRSPNFSFCVHRFQYSINAQIARCGIDCISLDLAISIFFFCQFIQYLRFYVCIVLIRSSYSYIVYSFLLIFSSENIKMYFHFAILPLFATLQDSLIELFFLFLFLVFLFIKIDTSQMLVHVQFWYMIVRKIVVIVLYYQVL